MPKRSRAGQLTQEEKRVVKTMLHLEMRNQDIQALINLGRSHTVNSARITEVKQDKNQSNATESELEAFRLRKQFYDPKTGLNAVDDERLVRAREAMILAVQIFNSAGLQFKTEVFLVLCNIAWTYLLHDFHEKRGDRIVDKDGRSLLLSQMLKRQDCPLSQGQINNLKALSLLRDEVEHKLLGKSDANWQGLFQACCLNFEEVMCRLRGDRLSLSRDLSFALQFAKPDFHQVALVSKSNLPPHLQALDARLSNQFSEEERADLQYQFRVIYTLDAATKTSAHIEFVNPDSAQGKDIRNVLVNYKSSDHIYPYKPVEVCKTVTAKTKVTFLPHNHTQAWKLYRVRPPNGSGNPDKTDKKFCVYHPTHKDYTYSEKWIDKLVDAVKIEAEFDKIKAVKVN